MGIAKGAALFALKAYLSNLYLKNDGKYILINYQYVMKGNKSKKTTTAPQPSKQKKSFEPSSDLSIDSFWAHYSYNTPQRTKFIDLFILYLILIIKLQVFYRVVVGDDFPRNAFVSGTFCPLGVIVLLVIMRNEALNFRKFGQFFIGCLVLFVVGINFAG